MDDTMPSISKAQSNLMRAAEHGATFAKAEALRRSMSPGQLADFAKTPTKSLPKKAKRGRR